MLEFKRRRGRWPSQKEFRSSNGLPGYATIWRAFGNIRTAVELASPEAATE
jgi:hypothetical protein